MSHMCKCIYTASHPTRRFYFLDIKQKIKQLREIGTPGFGSAHMLAKEVRLNHTG